LKLLALISRPDSGEIFIDDAAVKEHGSTLFHLRSRIGYSFQEPLLLPYLSAVENISYVVSPLSSLSRSHLNDKATKLLVRLGLSERLANFPSKLSVGEKKRVDLSRALLKEPMVMIADEPFSSLDPQTSKAVMDVLREYVEKSGILVYSSTNPLDSRFASRTYNMN